MKITKARLKEIIREELINEGMDEGIMSTLMSKMAMDKKDRESSSERRIYQLELNPKEKELVDFLTSKNSDIIKAVTNIQKAQEIITSEAEADAKSKALTDMKRALDALMSARTLDPSAPGRTAYLDRLQPLEEVENVDPMRNIPPISKEDMEDLSKELRGNPSLLKKITDALKKIKLEESCDYEDSEGAMADSQLNRIADLATMVDDMVDDDTNLPEWVEAKITKAQDYLSAVMNYMKGEQADAQEDMMEEELTKTQIKKRDKRAKKIMPSTEEQYGKKRGKEIAYAIATDQVTEET